jgi:murein DD-endopeptidase MepM/ murein hydrolase activator NlpD
MSRPKLGLVAGVVLCLLAAITTITLRSGHGLASRAPGPTRSQLPPAGPPPLSIESHPIRPGDTLEAVLVRANLDRDTRLPLISAIQDAFDVRKFRANTELSFARLPGGPIQTAEYIISPDQRLHVVRADDGYDARVTDVPGQLSIVPVCGTLHNSLFVSIEQAGAAPELALELANIFAWDIDFNTDPQPGDQFCFLVEKKEYLNGQPPSWRKIHAAEYRNVNVLHEAFSFPDTDGKPRFYSRDGQSLQAAFLRSPLRFEARVSSRFSRARFHPILKRYRPHLGTDYAAPLGSTVQSIAPGRVVSSGYSGQAGNLIKISHPGGYESMYMHLARRAVKPGDRVDQGQAIGTVGSTGLSTGPHLDFRLRKNGNYVDFERIRPPRTTRIAPGKMPEFATARDQFAAQLEAARRAAQTLLAATPANSDEKSVD